MCRIEEGHISYKILERLILDFFLNKHEKYLSRVKDIFNSLDDNDDGIISVERIKEALSYIDPMNELKLDSESIIRLCDPMSTGLTTFTKYIQILSSVYIV